MSKKQVKTVVVPKEMASAVESRDIFKLTIPFRVSTHSFGKRRKVGTDAVDVKHVEDTAEERKIKSMLSLNKKLLESESVSAIEQRDRRFLNWLRAISTPIGDAIFLVSVPLAEKVDDEAQAWMAERAELVKTAGRTYLTDIALTKEKLGPTFDEKDYPSREEFEASFSADVRFMNFGVPEVLKSVKDSIFRRETEKVRKQAADAAQQIQNHLAVSLHEITAHLAELLAPKANGRKTVLREKALDRLNTYLDTLALRDVTNFSALQKVAKTLRDASAGVSVQDLRDDTALRTRIAAQMEAAKEAVSALVEDGPVRAIRFMDEGVA